MKSLTISTLVATVFLATTSVNAGVVVIGNNALDAVDAKAIKKLFLGKSNEIGGVVATPVDQTANSPVRNEFLQKVLGQTPEDNKAHWTEQIFTGQSTPPKEVGDDAKVKAFVSSTLGAVGYINESAVDATVKILLK